jgi:hypothetical protein
VIRNVVLVKLKAGADAGEVAAYRDYDLDAAHNRYRARLGPLAEQIARVQFELPAG